MDIASSGTCRGRSIVYDFHGTDSVWLLLLLLLMMMMMMMLLLLLLHIWRLPS